MQDALSTAAAQAPCEPLPDQDLHAFLSTALADGPCGDIEVLARTVRKRRRDWRGARLFERVTVRRTAGQPFSLFLKYRRQHSDPTAPVTSVDREARVYRHLLQNGPDGPAKFYGAGSFDRDGSSLLLLEYLEGEKLKKIYRQEPWHSVVKWLARMHVHFAARQDEVRACVPRYDADFYWSWAQRAAETVFAVSPRAGSGMERVLSRYDRVAGLLGDAPATLIHGEFYCTNIMVSGDPQRLRICAFDWETAALGCAALDLTYLFRQECGIDEPGLIQAYLDGWREAGGRVLSRAELEAQTFGARTHELMYRLWSRMSHNELPAAKIRKYTDRALGYMNRMGTAAAS
jgi:Ser/Thr protein kinase RdoA (MazF antagonist)